tara:strand:+ start:52 stop:669 length:618 start_codon:yes stop_codon:yes gene_type:complete
MKGRIIDFYSGFGGASEAFVNDGRYQVVRIDNNVALKDIEHMYYADITKIDVTDIEFMYGKANLMIFGIPCYEYSLAYSAPHAIAIREGRKNSYKPCMKNLEKAMQIIEHCKPKYWIIENVVGAVGFFEEFGLGMPTQQVGPFVLWHNLPLLSLSKVGLEEVKGHKGKADKGPGPLRSNYRAKWPLVLSRSLLKSFETPTLEDWL